MKPTTKTKTESFLQYDYILCWGHWVKDLYIIYACVHFRSKIKELYPELQIAMHIPYSH